MDARSVDVVVVGGGPAGLQAVVAASAAGASCLLIEREKRPGGILKQCIHDGFGVLRYGERLTGPEYAFRDVARIRNAAVPVIPDAFVHSVEPSDGGWLLTVVTPERAVEQISGKSLVMATGCRERTDRQVLLHGDRPAGIFTAGQAQRLINIDGVMPGRRAVILGSGDIGLIMARRLVLEGAEVIGVYEMKSRPSGLPRNIAACLDDWDIPLHLSTTVTEVHGSARVEAVTVCAVGPDGQPDRRDSRRVACDTLILSVGLIPENDILIDRGLEPDPVTNGPAVDQKRESAFPGVFVCGNALHVYDLVDYVSECGSIAGTAAARRALAASVPMVPARTRVPARIPVHTGGELVYQVPQILDTAGPEPPVFFFRVARTMGRARIELSVDRNIVYTRNLSFLSPPEMGRIALDAAAWTAIQQTVRSARAAEWTGAQGAAQPAGPTATLPVIELTLTETPSPVSGTAGVIGTARIPDEPDG